jgi:predicted HTH transcriptional regulator
VQWRGTQDLENKPNWCTIRSMSHTASEITPQKEILQYLGKNGERFETDIAEATGISRTNVRRYLSELASNGEIMTCLSIRYDKGKKIEGISCRLTGFIPPASPGRKTKAQSSS